MEDKKLLSVPAKRRCYPESRLKVVLGRLCLAPGTTYVAKETITLADLELFTFVRKEIKRLGYGFFCGAELVVVVQQQSEALQGSRLFRSAIEPSVNFQCLLHL